MQECEGGRGEVRRLKHQRPTSHEAGMRETLMRTHERLPANDGLPLVHFTRWRLLKSRSTRQAPVANSAPATRSIK